jgi:2-methylcitrate dehydratase PrpD
VISRAEDLFIDWFASGLGGKGARPVRAMEAVAAAMGPSHGGSEVLVSRQRTSPLFAALVNGASSHFVEQDDVHNSSVFHPGTVVFSSALAAAQALRASGREFLTAAVAGYEMGIRIGEFLGCSHYKVFRTTGTAGTVAAAAAVDRLLWLDESQMLHAFGSAGTQAVDLWEFLRDAADSKQLHAAKAAGDGLLSAYLAREGFTGARRILEGPSGMAAGMSQDADPARLTNGLDVRWALIETSFKYHASCRHTHPAADALLAVKIQNDLHADQIRRIMAHVHRDAIDVLGRVKYPEAAYQAKFSMGTVLALIARFGRAGLAEFDARFKDQETAALCARVAMELDPEVDAYPKRWIGKVTVELADGRRLDGRIDEPKGDPGNTLSRPEIEEKAFRLAEFSGGATRLEMRAALDKLWAVAGAPEVGFLLERAPRMAVTI